MNESPHDFIDMTGDRFCRVIMNRQQDGARVGCVCGNDRLSCTRKGHVAKQGVAHKEGPPRFYVKFPGSRGACDGRLDRVAHTRSEGERMLQASRDEMQRMAQVLSEATIDEDSDGIESITDRAHRTTSGTSAVNTPQVSNNTNVFNRVTKYVLGSVRTNRVARNNTEAALNDASNSPATRGSRANTINLVHRNTTTPSVDPSPSIRDNRTSTYGSPDRSRRSVSKTGVYDSIGFPQPVFVSEVVGRVTMAPSNSGTSANNDVGAAPSRETRRGTNTVRGNQEGNAVGVTARSRKDREGDESLRVRNLENQGTSTFPSSGIATRTEASLASSVSLRRDNIAGQENHGGAIITGTTSSPPDRDRRPKFSSRNYVNTEFHTAARPTTTTGTEVDSPEPITWVGLEHPRTLHRVFYADDPDGMMAAVQRRGYLVKKTFKLSRGASKWANESKVDMYGNPIQYNRLKDPPPPVFPADRNNRDPYNFPDPPNIGRQTRYGQLPAVSQNGTIKGNGTNRTSQQPVSGRFEPLVHDLSTLSGDAHNSDDDYDSPAEIHRAPKPSRRRTQGKSHKYRRDWYGVEKDSDGERAITNRLQTVRELQGEGFVLKEVFVTKEEATRWMNSAPLKETAVIDLDSEDEADEVAFSGKRTIKNGVLPKTKRPPPVPIVTEVPPAAPSVPAPVPTRSLLSLSSAEFFRAETAGADPSIGNKEQIYGIPHDNIEEMDMALCPPHMTSSERESFLETVVDVTALPGMFRSNNDGGDMTMDTDTATSIVATALGKKVSMTDVMWRSPAKNALSRVKTQAQLYDIINSIERSGRIAFQQQEGRMRAIMYRCNYDRVSIQLYLQAGLLPRIMRASHDRYIALLYKARQKVIEHGSWDDSLGYEMIMHHSRETLSLRTFSVDWRNFVVQTYIYLRDAERKSYVDETMYESLFNRQTLNSANGSGAASRSRDRTPAADAPSVCSHCRCPIGEAHSGGKASCVFSSLPYAKAKEAGRLLLQAIRDSPKLDKAKRVKELLDEFGSNK